MHLVLEVGAVHGLGRVVIIAVGVIVILAIFIPLALPMRRGGYGPPLGMGGPVTRKGKERVNRSYEEHGWAKPYDDEGNLLPRSERQVPDG